MHIPLILYGTYGCHLCEQALGLFLAAGAQARFELREVDILDDPELEERYGVRIPVLRHPESGQEIDGPFDNAELEQFLSRLLAASG